jgi:methionine salvage enolase-phosphatase E1
MAPGVWAEAVGQLASTLTPNLEFINAVKTLKTVFPHLRVHAFSNISAPDFETIKEIVDSWDIFDSVTTSAAIGCRKPDLDSYRRMLASVDIEPRTSIFVDDLGDNVINAQSLGIRGVQFRDTKAVITQLHNLLGDPVTRGMNFLRQNAKNLFTETDTGTIVKDNFTQLLILFCIGDRFGLPSVVCQRLVLTVSQRHGHS